jgi:tetratricopeptide (TPR) repeat protein
LFLALLVSALAAAAAAQGQSPAALSPDSQKRLVEDGHWKRARAALEPRVQSNPRDAEAAWLLSRVRNAWKEYDAAVKLAETAAALDPKNAEYRWVVAENVGEQAEDASWFRALGLARRFKREAEAAAALDAGYVAPRWGLMEFHMRAPGVAGGDKKRAYALLEEIKRISAVQGPLAEFRMTQLEKKNESPEPYYLRAYQADPKHYGANMNLARFYTRDTQKKFDLAEKFARAAMQLEPFRAGPYATLALVYAVQQRWKELDELLSQFEKAIPDSSIAHYQAAAMLRVSGADLPRAERYLRKYLSVEPEPGYPTHADAHWLLAMVSEKMGRNADAVRELEAALRLNPGHDAAKKDLKRLKK